MRPVLRDHDLHTYGDYLNWPEDVRYELIDGIAYRMAPAPLLEHQEVAGQIYRQAANALSGQPCRAFIAPVDVRLPKLDEADERIDTVVHPGDRLLTVYRLVNAECGKPEVQELAGETPVGVVPEVVIVWGELVGRLAPLDY